MSYEPFGPNGGSWASQDAYMKAEALRQAKSNAQRTEKRLSSSGPGCWPEDARIPQAASRRRRRTSQACRHQPLACVSWQ